MRFEMTDFSEKLDQIASNIIYLKQVKKKLSPSYINKKIDFKDDHKFKN